MVGVRLCSSLPFPYCCMWVVFLGFYGICFVSSPHGHLGYCLVVIGRIFEDKLRIFVCSLHVVDLCN